MNGNGYVEKKAVLRLIREYIYAHAFFHPEDAKGISAFIDAVMDLPEFEAVEVVRCKDCKNRVVRTMWSDELDMYIAKAFCKKTPRQKFEFLEEEERENERFCADGERRTK